MGAPPGASRASAARVLRAWAAAEPGKPVEGLTLKQEMKLIGDAMDHNDKDVLGRYGGFNEALQRLAALQQMPEAKVTQGASIDDYRTWRATRFAVPQETG